MDSIKRCSIYIILKLYVLPNLSSSFATGELSLSLKSVMGDTDIFSHNNEL